MGKPGSAARLPCPFCGGRAVTERAYGDIISMVCTGCGAVCVHKTAQGRAGLVAAWNRRQSRVNLQRRGGAQPCPFCASAQVAPGGQSGAILTCRGCGMMTSFANADSPGAALSLWNRRV